ncbi:MAG: hypothetical protein H6694_08315 [Candidatus Latescibacteria bacterium]|nr:hypothetical protein [Candidatus Latescibacterota bacterium]
MIAVLVEGPARAATLLVPEEQPTIEGALAAAAFGDTVSIAPGTYYEHDLVWPPGVSILGRGLGAEDVVIDAQFQGRVMGGEELVSSNELGFLTIRNGDAAGYYGSGLKVAGSPNLHDLIIEECRNSFGGVGMYCIGSPHIVDSAFVNNGSTELESIGGGLFLNGDQSGPVLENVVFADNTAGSGGGLFYGGHFGTLLNVRFQDNTAARDGVEPGSRIRWALTPTVPGSSAPSSRGITQETPVVVWKPDANVVMVECTTVVGNSAEYAYGAGGGFMSSSYWDLQNTPRLFRCIVANNEGGGVGLRDEPQILLECCDVYGNMGGRLCLEPGGLDGREWQHLGGSALLPGRGRRSLSDSVGLPLCTNRQ